VVSGMGDTGWWHHGNLIHGCGPLESGWVDLESSNGVQGWCMDLGFDVTSLFWVGL